jgi:hypothetical protein
LLWVAGRSVTLLYSVFDYFQHIVLPSAFWVDDKLVKTFYSLAKQKTSYARRKRSIISAYQSTS